MTATTTPTSVAVPISAAIASSTEPRREWMPGPRRDEHVEQDGVADQLLHRRAPLQQGEVGPGVLKRAGPLDHPELVGPGVRLCRGPAALVQDHHEQRSRGQQVRWRDDLPADERAVAARAYGRSVPVTSATMNTTNSATGSVIAPQVLARLARICARGCGVESRARDQEAGQAPVKRVSLYHLHLARPVRAMASGGVSM
jgi:hypothetical protein